MSSIARPVARSVSRSVLAGQGVDLGYLIRSMFSSGEQGFFYDPNDLTTMFQDAAGTIPVTGAGQAVGLMLDKSKGLVLGAERLANGDFSAGSANWGVGNADATHIVTFADGKVRYQSDTISPVLTLTQGGAMITGKWYEVTISCSSYVSGSLKIDGLNGSVVVANGLGTIKAKFLATSNTLVLVRNSANVDLTIDSISVKELAGNHAYQTTSASRPILRRNATTGAYYLEFDGSDDFLQTSNIDFTGTDKVSLFAGVRKLSDAAPSVLVELSASIANVGTFNIQAPRTGNSYGVGVRGSIINGVDYSTYTAPISNVISLKLTTSATNYLGAIMGRFDGVNTAGSTNSSAASTGNYGNHPLYIGRRGGTSLPFNGYIYGLIGVGRLTTDSETTALEKELAKRLGVTLNV